MLKRLLLDSVVEWFYLRAGIRFGEVVSYLYMGECCGFTDMLQRWERWEAEYARRGYMTLAIDDFIAMADDAEPDGLGIKRQPGEPAVFHAQLYRQLYLGRAEPVVTPQELMAGPQSGTYVLPSTQHHQEATGGNPWRNGGVTRSDITPMPRPSGRGAGFAANLPLSGGQS